MALPARFEHMAQQKPAGQPKSVLQILRRPAVRTGLADPQEGRQPKQPVVPRLTGRLATGATSDLVYVSPKSGGAVSRTAGEPWRDRLFRLPAFLRHDEAGSNGWSAQDLQDGFRLTGWFLLRHVLEPRGQGHSDARDGFINAVTRQQARRAAVP